MISLQVLTKKKQNTRRVYQDSSLSIRAYSGYSGIIQSYSEPCVTLAYSELWYIQNASIFKTRNIFKTLAHGEPETYSESWAIQNLGIFRTRGILRTLSNIDDGAL